jgi:lysozyme family protein
MDNEDPARAFAQGPDPCPKGVAGPCYAIGGVNSGAWPEEYAAIAAADPGDRLGLIQQFYQSHFWNNWYAQLNSDDLCKRVFDFAVNGGTGASVRCLQRGVNRLAAPGADPLAEDGGWGPATLGAANAAYPAALLTAFQDARVAFYQSIAASDPSKEKYLNGWTARAEVAGCRRFRSPFTGPAPVSGG